MFSTFSQSLEPSRGQGVGPLSSGALPCRLAMCTFEKMPLPLCLINGQKEVVGRNEAFITAFPALTNPEEVAAMLHGTFSLSLDGPEKNTQLYQGTHWYACTTVLEAGYLLVSLTPEPTPQANRQENIKASTLSPPIQQDPVRKPHTDQRHSMDDLASGIAHDFNNNLTGIIGFCDLLLMRIGREDTNYTDVLQIKQNANRSATLVQQLLTFSKQKTGETRTLDVNHLLTSLTLDLERTLGPRISFSTQLTESTSFIRADIPQFEECFRVLATRAWEQSQSLPRSPDRKALFHIDTTVGPAPPGLSSRLSLQESAYLVISVTDTGQEIPEEDLPYIFDPFFTSSKLGKQGLGLATVYGIVQQMKGGIGVTSSREKGTTFTMAFSLAQTPTTPDVSSAHQRPSKNNATKKSAPTDTTLDGAHEGALEGSGAILFVEDEDAIRMFGARALRNKGYRVIEAQNGQEALDFLKSSENESIDLIITDVVMPQMDGPTLVQHVRQVSPELKVIFISGYAEDSFRKQLGENENLIFLPKPFSLDALATLVKQVLCPRQETR